MKKEIALLLLAIMLGFSSCVTFKQQALFDAPSGQQEPEGIGSFYSLDIYHDNLTGEAWFTQAPNCLSVTVTTDEAYAGNTSMRWEWNKNAGNCPWTGIGFGWDGWAPKDISQVLDRAAIQMQVKSVSGSLGGLPLAASLEDYSGAQAWLGISDKALQGQTVTDTAWTTVVLPFAEFGWSENDANYYNIKQFIIQFEASGAIYVDEIKVVPFDGGFYNRYTALWTENAAIEIDAKNTESLWAEAEAVTFAGHTAKLLADNEFLYCWLKVKDDTPLQNTQQNENISKGDAFEMAFSTDASITPRRVRYRTTDRHIGVRASQNPVVWDWTNEKPLENVQIQTAEKPDGYVIEMKIPFTELGFDGFETRALYGVELAVDKGNSSGQREEQHRWNSPDNEGFHQTPNLWGELVFKKKNNPE